MLSLSFLCQVHVSPKSLSWPHIVLKSLAQSVQGMFTVMLLLLDMHAISWYLLEQQAVQAEVQVFLVPFAPYPLL